MRTRDGCERFWLMQTEMQWHRYLSKPVDLNELETKLRQWLPQAEEKRASTEAVVNMSRRSA